MRNTKSSESDKEQDQIKLYDFEPKFSSDEEDEEEE